MTARHVDLVVLGAGGAGLLCAREAALRGRRTILVDRAERPGRKILISGGGRCNFTNLEAGPGAYVSQNPSFCASALARYPPAEFLQLVERHGIPYHEKKLGQLFCDRRADDILDMLLDECRNAGVEFAFGGEVDGIERGDGRFLLGVNGRALESEKLVVATGGLSVPKTGATGFGHDLARRFGLAVVRPEPALVGLTWDDAGRERWGELAGLALPDAVVACGGAVFREAVLFTHSGLSGPAILQASLYWHPRAPVSIDLLPDTDAAAALRRARSGRGGATAAEILLAPLPRRFANRFAAAVLPREPVARFGDAEIERVAGLVKRWTVTPAGTEGFNRAEVTRGGVDTRALSSKTMEARKVPGLYFIGEVVDVTGRLGGYNFQWAWASGAAAGRSV